MADSTPKGYWLVHLTVHDAGEFMAYMRASRAIFKEWNATYVVQAGQAETREGAACDKHVVVMFESYEAARACYESAEYQDAIKLRDDCANFNLVIAEGVS
ncbi:MAG: DUF1330 domain-containing protein [Methyloligellaceae bacterium]